MCVEQPRQGSAERTHRSSTTHVGLIVVVVQRVAAEIEILVLLHRVIAQIVVRILRFDHDVGFIEEVLGDQNPDRFAVGAAVQLLLDDGRNIVECSRVSYSLACSMSSTKATTTYSLTFMFPLLPFLGCLFISASSS